MRCLDQRQDLDFTSSGSSDNPVKIPASVKLAPRLEPIARQRGVAFPFFREAVIEACQRAANEIAFGPEQFESRSARVPPLSSAEREARV